MSRVPSSFAVPSPPPADELVRLLGDRLGAVDEPPRTQTRIVLDSADRMLRDAGLVLELVRVADGTTSAVVRQWGAVPTELSVPIEQTPASADDLPARLQSAVAAVLDDRPLRTVGALDVDVHPLSVRDKSDKTVLRAFIDVTSSGTWVRLSPVRGYASAASQANRAVAKLGLRPDAELAEHLYEYTAPTDADVEHEIESDESAAAQPAAAAWVAVLRAQLDEASAHLPGAIDGTDPEELHDVRVAVRRSRSALRHGHDVLPPELIGCFRPELTAFQRAAAAARDLDVLIDDVKGANDDTRLDPLLSLLRSERDTARRDLTLLLGSDETNALFDDWRNTLDALAASIDDEDADEWGHWPTDAHRAIGDVVAERINHQRARVMKRGKAINKKSAPEAFHELRKQGKELRYLIELFGAHVPELATPDVISRLKDLQDVLGRYQDLTVQHAALLRYRDRMQPSARAAVDALLDRLDREQRDDRRAFASRFKKFAAALERTAMGHA